jgi:hypothetical protein
VPYHLWSAVGGFLQVSSIAHLGHRPFSQRLAAKTAVTARNAPRNTLNLIFYNFFDIRYTEFVSRLRPTRASKSLKRPLDNLFFIC